MQTTRRAEAMGETRVSPRRGPATESPAGIKTNRLHLTHRLTTLLYALSCP